MIPVARWRQAGAVEVEEARPLAAQITKHAEERDHVIVGD